MGDAASAMGHVVFALILRETQTRYGRHPGGYLWAIVEPVFFISCLLFISNALGRSSHTGITAMHFASGVLTFMLFRQTVQQSLAAVSGNRGLLMHPIVTPLDIILARVLLEAATNLLVTCIVAVGIFVIWGLGPPASPLGLLGIIALSSSLGLAFGLLFGAAAGVWPIVERILSPVMRVMFYISGVFFVPSALPSNVRDALLWNPVLHVTEAARVAWLEMPPETYGTLAYPVAVCAGTLLVGMAAERLARSRISGA
jgi:capsular polysaccharide transport system permease protein